MHSLTPHKETGLGQCWCCAWIRKRSEAIVITLTLDFGKVFGMSLNCAAQVLFVFKCIPKFLRFKNFTLIGLNWTMSTAWNRSLLGVSVRQGTEWSVHTSITITVKSGYHFDTHLNNFLTKTLSWVLAIWQSNGISSHWNEKDNGLELPCQIRVSVDLSICEHPKKSIESQVVVKPTNFVSQGRCLEH